MYKKSHIWSSVELTNNCFNAMLIRNDLVEYFCFAAKESIAFSVSFSNRVEMRVEKSFFVMVCNILVS